MNTLAIGCLSCNVCRNKCTKYQRRAFFGEFVRKYEVPVASAISFYMNILTHHIKTWDSPVDVTDRSKVKGTLPTECSGGIGNWQG